MSVRLTKAEQSWIEQVQALLDVCPSKRLGFYTIGDSDVSIYDATKDAKIDDIMMTSNKDYGHAVEEAGADTIAQFIFPNAVHSVVG
jgi:hypothetical protein